jgi:hypothetical protein
MDNQNFLVAHFWLPQLATDYFSIYSILWAEIFFWDLPERFLVLQSKVSISPTIEENLAIAQIF